MGRHSERLTPKIIKESLELGGCEEDPAAYTVRDPTGDPYFNKGGHLQRSIHHSSQHARRFKTEQTTELRLD